ncbi:hypothetical protein PR202_ga16611 [Eleusine coracana subsp. coracana]|uniref:Major facilitator superfamily (MFS) profile domain-containing protein n=1 Tax=Eleusine coracana subsp. coracana TaxID=191504 RepID=A0AAV5CN27_ELECO|nr:hypothetical protein PR202_ga16611 [Eleusine coracana subsp. coracana]
MATSALRFDGYHQLAGGSHHCLLRMLPPRALFPQRRRLWLRAVKVSSREGGGGGGLGSAVEKRSVPGALGQEEQGAKGEEEVGGSLELRWPPWEGLAERYRLIGATSLAFVICNMDKVNLSVAIIPMSHQYGWSSSTAGLVQSSFFWGYALSQLPGGWLAKLFGGRLEMLYEVLYAIVQSWGEDIFVCFALFQDGLCQELSYQGFWPPLALTCRSIPLQERSRAVAVVFGGLSFGSVLGLLFAPPIIQNLGWESVFYIFGLLGIIWCLGFESLKEQQLGDNEGILRCGTCRDPAAPAGSMQRFCPTICGYRLMVVICFYFADFGQGSVGSDGLIPLSVASESSDSSLENLQNSLKDVPWGAFFKSKAVWAMIYAHFCGSWGHYTEELNLNLTEAAWVSVLPPLGSMVITSIAAPFADNLISNGVDTTKVNNLPLIIHPFMGLLSGITNTVGAVPGIVGVALTGYLLDSTHSWSISLFAPSIFFYLTGTAVWLAFASSEPQDFSKSEQES